MHSNAKAEDYDYVKYNHSPHGNQKQLVHVTSLPPTSVLQSTQKLILNKTTSNAAWCSPRTKESFELQEALLYVMDEDVIVVDIHTHRSLLIVYEY